MKRTAPQHARKPDVLRKTLRIQSRFGMAVVLALLVGQGVSWASWISSGGGSSSLVTAGALTVPGLPSPSQVPGGKTVSITWSAVSSATNYSVFYYTAAVGGTPATACTTSGTSCVDPSARVVPAWYSVQARAGSNWLAESARVAYIPDVTTSVAISALGTDAGSSGSDFITNAAGNTLTGTSEAGASIVIQRGGTQIATATANGSGNWISSSFALNEGLQNLDVTATDAYANTATATQSNVRLDTVAPTMSWSSTCTTTGNTSPVGGTGQNAWCKQSTRDATPVFDTDVGSGLDLTTRQYKNGTGAWTPWSTGAISMSEFNGRIMQLSATDIAGNVGTTSQTYYIDVTAPVVVVTYPTPGLSVNLLGLLAGLGTNCTSSQSACGTAIDLVSGTASVAWNLNRAIILQSTVCMDATGSYTTGNCSSFFGATLSSPNWSVNVNPSTAYAGLLPTFTFEVHATDSAGNTSADTTVIFTLL